VVAGTSYGPITMPGQVDVIRRHIADAIEKGGRALTGGHIDGGLVEPTVLVDVPEDSVAVTEETFGPTLTVTKVRDTDEAVERSNATTYGLAGSVFAKRGGVDIARRLRTGMTSVNQVVAFAGIPSLPFGGSGDSGFGRIHGEDGLKEFARAKAITRQRFDLPVPLLSFDRTPRIDALLGRAVRFLHGRG
jgi:acyl-CoA reductase-like NAD-dependent aldehyde dehydrogenase